MLAGELYDAFATPYTGPFNLDGQISLSPIAGLGSENESVDSSQSTGVSSKDVFRQRMDLPMIIRNSTIIARPDSGSEDNIITIDLARSLNLEFDRAPECQKDYRIANGKMVKALGRTKINCCFAKDPMVEFGCIFYVFQYCISPLIMGMAFLDTTRTLTEYRHRLCPRKIPPAFPFQVCSLDYPRRQLYCLANSEPTLANADTGSEMNLMSLAYVQKRGFFVMEVDKLRSEVQLADGSVSKLQAKVEVEIRIGDERSAQYSMEFYVFDGLICDVLLGEDFLYSTSAFESYHNAFALDSDDDGICEVTPIVWFNRPESRLFNSRTGAEDQTSGKFNFVFQTILMRTT